MRGRVVGKNMRAVDRHVDVLQDGKVKREKRNASDGMPILRCLAIHDSLSIHVCLSVRRTLLHDVIEKLPAANNRGVRHRRRLQDGAAMRGVQLIGAMVGCTTRKWSVYRGSGWTSVRKLPPTAEKYDIRAFPPH